ncbi:MAG: tetratricopeptide repeat protein [Pseudomonadota bacterium]|nr:tetratricopeptide repeat protein [Pseudomonadota bacterium]
MTRIFLSIFIILGAFISLGCQSPEGKVSSYIAAAEVLLEEKDLVKADLELKNALQIDPKNSRANFLLATISEASKDFPQMASRLRAAIDGDPNFIAARVKLGTLYSLAGSNEKAQEQYAALLDLNPVLPSVKVFGARLSIVEGNLKQSKTMLEEALLLEPSNVQALGLLAGIAAKDDLDSAIDLLTQGISVSEDPRQLRLLRLRLLFQQKRFEEIEAEYNSLVNDYPEEVLFSYQLSDFLVGQGREDSAEVVLRETVENNPDELEPKLKLIQFLSSVRGTEEALKTLREFLKKNQRLFELRNVLAEYLQSLGREDDAYNQYQIISDGAGNEDIGLNAQAKMAGILISKKDYKNGMEMLEDIILKDAMNVEALILRGAVLSEREEYRNAVSDFRSVLRQQPKNQRAQLLLAQTHALAKDTVLAKDAYRRVIENHPEESSAPLSLAKLLIEEGNPNDAERILKDRLNISPNDINAASMLVMLFKSKQNIREAFNLASQISKTKSGEAPGYYLLGNLYAAENNYSQAIDAFKLSLEFSPLAWEPFQGLVNALVQDNRQKEAKILLSDFTSLYPNNFLAMNLFGEFLASQGDREAAKLLFESILIKNKTWLRAYIALASLAGDSSAASVEILERGLAAIPGSQELTLLLGSIFEKNNQIEDAISLYENTLIANNDLSFVANNLAALLADHRDDAESFQRALSLVKKFENSDNPAFIDTLGWVYYRLGETEEALFFLKNAVEYETRIPAIRYHLGMAYFANGETALAKKELQKVIDLGQKDFTGYKEAQETLILLTN